MCPRNETGQLKLQGSLFLNKLINKVTLTLTLFDSSGASSVFIINNIKASTVLAPVKDIFFIMYTSSNVITTL